MDVAVCTYQSEKFPDQCSTSIEQTVPVNRLIIVDHYSIRGLWKLPRNITLAKQRTQLPRLRRMRSLKIDIVVRTFNGRTEELENGKHWIIET